MLLCVCFNWTHLGGATGILGMLCDCGLPLCHELITCLYSHDFVKEIALVSLPSAKNKAKSSLNTTNMRKQSRLIQCK